MAKFSPDEINAFFSKKSDDLNDLNVVWSGLGHDYFTDSYKLVFARGADSVTLNVVHEKLSDILSGDRFAWKHFRKQIEGAFDHD